MNNKRIYNIFTRIYFTHVTPPLGRWGIHNHTQNILKTKYANEDNCGVSGNIYKNITPIQKINETADNEYIYMMGYESVHQ